jgi:uncharacterized membrane protein
MDCYFHANVPSIAPCTDCGKAICATCRDDRGACPSCRLAAKIDAASAGQQQIGGTVPPRPRPAPAGAQAQAQPQTRAAIVAPADPVESRALVALGYPLWPLALLALLDRKQSTFLRRQTLQALGFNVGFAGFWGLLTLLTNVPWLGVSAEILIPLLIPMFLVASVYFGIKTWLGEEVRVPIISDWIDEKIPA